MYNIAIVDDSSNERFILKRLLEGCGHQVVAEGADGLDAVRICVAVRPALVMLDVRMPRMGGLAAVMEINRLGFTVCMLLTACVDDDTVRAAAEAGVMGYLVKPLRQEELNPAIALAMTRFAEFKALKEENAELKAALAVRKVIEKAKGLLMEKERLTEDEAFARIRGMSMERRLPMSQVAESLIIVFGGAKP